MKLIDIRRFVAEVLIIVLGVLIALAVNNWNSNRIDRNLEAQYPVRLMEDLDGRSEVVAGILSMVDSKLESLREVDALLRAQSDNPDFFQDLVAALRNDALVFGRVLPEFPNYTYD